jgi:hypothetical protein
MAGQASGPRGVHPGLPHTTRERGACRSTQRALKAYWFVTRALDTEEALKLHSPGQAMAELTAAATMRTEVTHQRVVFAWRQILFTELRRVWAQLETEEALAYEDKVACCRHRLGGGAGTATLGLEECQQVGVELVLVRVGRAVGCPWIDLQGRILDEFR